MPNLPSLSKLPSSQSFASYSTCPYTTRNNVLLGEKGSSRIVPHPPTRQRPVSANPISSSNFQSFKKPIIAGNWTNGLLGCDNECSSPPLHHYNLTHMDSGIPKLEKEEITIDNECFKKDCIIEGLRDEIRFLRANCGDTTPPTGSLSTGCHQKIANLHNQIQLLDEDNDHLRIANETMRRENDTLRGESDNLRRETESLCANEKNENERLKNDLENLNITYHLVTQKGNELNELLSQRERKIAHLENDLDRACKEKSQTTVIVTTLQKEVTSKDEQLQKSKMELDRQRIELENKKNEVSTMASRLARNLEYKKAARDLKIKEEEVSRMKHEIKSLEEKIALKDGTLLKLHEDVKETTKQLADNDALHKSQLKAFQDKLRAKETNLKQVNVQLTASKLALEEKNERERLHSMNEIEATEKISNVLCDIEKRLVQNGRSCKSLNEEIVALRDFEASENLGWVKECFLSLLCQEVNWWKGMEEGLRDICGGLEHADTPPSVLIQLIQEKTRSTDDVVISLETQINVESLKHKQEMEDMESKLKEKYKMKAEKAIREMREEEVRKHEEQLMRVKEEESDHLTRALKTQREVIMEEVCDVESLKEEVVALKSERDKMKEDIEELRKDIERCHQNEMEYKEKFERSEEAKKVYETTMESKVSEEVASKKEMLEKMKKMEEHVNHLKESNDVKRSELDETKTNYMGKVSEQSELIAALEYEVVTLKHAKGTLQRKALMYDELLKDYKDKELLQKQAEDKAETMGKEINELLATNETLKTKAEDARVKCDQEKEVTKEMKEELQRTLAKLSDLKADLSDKEKQKMEQLNEKCSKQEKEMMQQQIHLVKLSTLVDEQMSKLVEQDKLVREQYEMLSDRHIPWDRAGTAVPTPLVLRKKVKELESSDGYSDDVKGVGELCIASRHEDIIKEQRHIIQDMRQTISSSPKIALIEDPSKTHMVEEMANTIHDLSNELMVQEHHSAVTDEKLYTEVCSLREELVSLNAELACERDAHQQNVTALEQSEAVYLTFVRDINKQLDIEEILGATPLSFSITEERERTLVQRGKGLEVITNRIKSIKARLVRKDQLLETYDDDLKKCRATETYADQKSLENQTLHTELKDCRSELSYLQEALKKYRSECEDLKRQNLLLKQKKVLHMDYKKKELSPSPSPPSPPSPPPPQPPSPPPQSKPRPLQMPLQHTKPKQQEEPSPQQPETPKQHKQKKKKKKHILFHKSNTSNSSSTASDSPVDIEVS